MIYDIKNEGDKKPMIKTIKIKSINHAVAYDKQKRLIGEVCKLSGVEEFVVFDRRSNHKTSFRVNTLNEGVKYLERM